MEINKEYIPFEELEAEQKQIENTFLTLRFTQKVRKEMISCFKRCGGTVSYPFRVIPYQLNGLNNVCFGDCVNINFEKGPYLKELGDVPEDAIPKKFIWPSVQ
ncbi:UNKNOWN [Stylonychia lemnae]|uniref:Uncharacterized protein n=1 Tax=Stylonychia lemnae TaxID=5949 RepID=A0A078B3B7_STYLE|nr:UNKNOWN [Stylonychia lemnae]|eukprot:CDW87993.1 UNKNOWN [Stylonychia lemnae]